jgi:NAD(P)-dependent dehydrogenase (short-subunit alcohol dehydrogenase family)
MDLKGRTVLITGASSGIGAATVEAMSRRGATPLLVARRERELRQVAASLSGPSGAYPCDVGDPDSVTAMAQAVLADHGTPDVIVNNAGVGRWLHIEETTPQEFLAQVAVPFHAAFFVTRAFIDPMLQRGEGWVVTVNSPAGYAAWPGAVGYGAARQAVRGFTDALAADLRGTGIGVTAVVAGHVDSEYFAHNPGSLERMPAIDRVVRRLNPGDVAEAICRGVQRERPLVVEPFEVRSLMALSRVAPSLVGRLAAIGAARRTTVHSG